MNVRGRKHCYLSLSDGGIRGRGTAYCFDSKGKKHAVSQDPYRACPLSYAGIKEEFKSLAFLIDAMSVKYLHGKCKITLYQDTGPVKEGYNPFRIIITNEDGWSISSDILLDFTAKEFDDKFNFEPINSSVIAEEPEHTAEIDVGNTYVENQRIVNQAETIPPANGTGIGNTNDTPLLHPKRPQKVLPSKKTICIIEYDKNSIPAQKIKKETTSSK